jgi:uncharacterized protein (TIGR00369 family)
MTVHSDAMLTAIGATSRVPLPGFPEALGIAVERCTASMVEGRMTAAAAHADASGARVHGGVLSGFADSLISAGAAVDLPAGQSVFTANANSHFIAGASLGILRGTARCLNRSTGTQTWQAEVFDGKDGLVAVVTQTQSVQGSSTVPQPMVPIALVSPRPPSGEYGTVPEQRLRQIVNAGSQVFGKSGYASTSMRDVAAAAGMPIATMYQYVSGKEKLLLLIFETYMAEISTALSKANDPAKTPRRRLHECVEATLELYDTYRRQIRLIYQEGRSLSPENRERVRRLAHSTHRVWEGILRDGMASGEFTCRDASVTASFIPLLCSIWVVRYSSVKGTTLEKLRESILELIEGGLRCAKRTKAVRG